MKRLYRYLVFSLLVRLRGEVFCKVYNMFMVLNGTQRRCRFIDGLYKLDEKSENIFFSRPARYRYYSDGIEKRLENLFLQYVGADFYIREGDVVLDCGANIGEFTMYCIARKAKVFSFEPDPVEFVALERNVGPSAIIFDVALWCEDKELALDLQNESGDTSVSEKELNHDVFTVEGRRLDGIDVIRSLPRIRLLKLEAEGFELEVLQGASALLADIEYVAADLGPERGESNESSLPGVMNFLQGRGFSVERFFSGRSIALFRNTALCDKAEVGARPPLKSKTGYL